MARVKIYKSLPHIFAPAYISEILTFLIFDLQQVKVMVIIAATPFDGKCRILKITPTYFCANSYRFSEL